MESTLIETPVCSDLVLETLQLYKVLANKYVNTALSYFVGHLPVVRISSRIDFTGRTGATPWLPDCQ